MAPEGILTNNLTDLHQTVRNGIIVFGVLSAVLVVFILVISCMVCRSSTLPTPWVRNRANIQGRTDTSGRKGSNPQWRLFESSSTT
jgi:hypothetical protein